MARSYIDPRYSRYSRDDSLDPQLVALMGEEEYYYGHEQVFGGQNLPSGFSGSQLYPGTGAVVGFDVIPEEVAVTHSQGGAQLDTAMSARQADSAFASWRVGKVPSTSTTSALNLSSRSSDVDLKEFLVQRGNHPLEGLHKAAVHGDRTSIMHLMKLHGPDAPIDALDSNGCSPLMYAVMADSRPALEMLLNFSARRDQTDPEGRTAVHYAAFFGKHRSLKFLIESASDWIPRDVYGRTPLHWACYTRSTRCLQVLLKHATVVFGDINPRDNEGMTPLHCAAHFCRPRHVILLNEADADFSAVDIEQKSALHWTINNPDSSCLQALVDAWPSLLNKKDSNGSTILHLTAANGSSHLVEALLRIDGIEIDAKDNADRTALHYACSQAHFEIVQLLLESKALDTCIDVDGFTALHYAVQSDSVASLRAFIKNPDLTHLPNNDGQTPLLLAAASGFEQAVEVLLEHATVVGSVNHTDSNGKSALHLAAQAGSAPSISSLLARGADPNLLDPLQQSPLFSACEGGHVDSVSMLLRGGCQPNTLDGDGQAPLHKAVLYGQAEVVETLALAGADLNITDSTQSTAVHMAAYAGNETILTTLLNNRANPNIQDSNGMSPLHLASMEGHSNCITILLANNAYPNFMDFSEESYTAVDYAMMNQHDDCVDILNDFRGVSTQNIRDMAATRIQAVYRGYKARMLRSELAVKKKAVTIIAKCYRGFRERQKYHELKRRHYAAIRIQSHIRGYLQRVKFYEQLGRYRKQERNRRLMEDFSQKLVESGEGLFLQAFMPKDDDVAKSKEVEERVIEELDPEAQAERESREQKLRMEAALKMREMYVEKQQKWIQFREAERQRRSDKAHQEELNRLAGVLASSRARHEVTRAKFHQTRTVRSYYDAALVIQRAFRQMKKRRIMQKRSEERKRAKTRRKENRAAITIQRSWRLYRQHLLYESLHFRSIQTGPVISLREQPLAYFQKQHKDDIRAYQKHTSITGKPRRKIHQTMEGGFKVFRPATRDLLMGSVDTATLLYPPPLDQQAVDRRVTVNSPQPVPSKPIARLTSPRGIKSLLQARECGSLLPPRSQLKHKAGAISGHMGDNKLHMDGNVLFAHPPHSQPRRLPGYSHEQQREGPEFHKLLPSINKKPRPLPVVRKDAGLSFHLPTIVKPSVM